MYHLHKKYERGSDKARVNTVNTSNIVTAASCSLLQHPPFITQSTTII